MLACDTMWCPKLDTTLKAQIPKAGKDGDRPLACLLLDAIGPLAILRENQWKGRVSPEAAVEVATQALCFLGNTNAQGDVR